jgi:hypothetical protein
MLISQTGFNDTVSTYWASVLAITTLYISSICHKPTLHRLCIGRNLFPEQFPYQLLQHLSCKIAMLPAFVLLQNFQPMYNQMAAVWVASNLPPPPLDVRIVSVTGQSVTAV